MKTEKKHNLKSPRLKLIINQLQSAYNGDPWYGSSLSLILELVDPGIVFNPQKNGAHSIAELLSHIITYREFAIRRLQGDHEYLPDQVSSFNWKQYTTRRQNAYEELLNRFHTSQKCLASLLRNLDDSILDQTVACKLYSFNYLLNGIIQHDLYHFGQISYINRMYKTGDHELPGYKVFSYESLSSTK